MRVDPVLLRTVMFLCQEREDENGVLCKVPVATAFLVRIEWRDLTWKYLVTARHNIERAREPIYVRYNKKSGGFGHFETTKDDWEPDYHYDVSCKLFWGPSSPKEEIDHASIPITQFVGRDYRYSGPPLTEESEPFPVGLGDDLAFVGLFSKHSGESRNVPIVRFGNISALPGDPIHVALGRKDAPCEFDVVGFLAECRSWGGHSGSPVFWISSTMGRLVESGMVKGPEKLHSLNGLLGLVSAHFDIEQEAWGTGIYDGNIFVPVNSGIAVITTSAAILGLLERDDMKEARERDKVRLRQSTSRYC